VRSNEELDAQRFEPEHQLRFPWIVMLAEMAQCLSPTLPNRGRSEVDSGHSGRRTSDRSARGSANHCLQRSAPGIWTS